MMLYLEWSDSRSPIIYDGIKGTLSLHILDQVVTLTLQPVLAQLTLYEDALTFNKESLQGNSIFIAQLFSVTATQVNGQQVYSSEVQQILDNYSSVFSEPTSLPPTRSYDYQIISCLVAKLSI
jgi:hypothetical protein